MDLRQYRKPFLLPAIITSIVVLPLVIWGLHDSTDLYQHIQFASTFHTSILNGDLYPSWSDEENLGYGSVGTRFYPPLFHFLLAMLKIALGSWHAAICVVLFAFWLTGAYGVYLWAKEFTAEKEATIAAAAFLLIPYLLSQVYTSAFYSQSCAVSVLPFAFMFVTRICRGGGLGNVIGLAISLSMVILTNLPATVVGGLSLAVYSVSSLDRRSGLKTIVGLAFGVILALAATSFYWLRMYPEMEFFRNTRFWADATFDWSEHFLLTPPSKLVFGLWFNNYTLIASMLVALCGMAGTKRLSGMKALVILFAFAVFMTTPLSTPLWLYFPYLKEVQFPGRWQTIVSVTAAVIFGIGSVGLYADIKNRLSGSKLRLVLAAFTFLAVGIVLGQVVTKYSKHRILRNDFSRWAENDINSLGFEFFWTIEAKKEAFAVTDKIVSAERKAELVSWTPGERQFDIEAGPASKVRVATLCYPRWQATVNDAAAEISPDENGAILVSIPPEASRVRVKFQEAWFMKIANFASAITWLSLLLAGGLIVARKAVLKRSQPAE